MKTAVEWLIEQLEPAIALQSKIIQEYVEQAKEMEKEQIIKAIDYCRDKYIDSENYYNETFKSE